MLNGIKSITNNSNKDVEATISCGLHALIANLPRQQYEEGEVSPVIYTGSKKVSG